MDDGRREQAAGTSGRRVILLMAAGLILIISVTLALYFATRQLDYVDPSSTPTPTSRVSGDARFATS